MSSQGSRAIHRNEFRYIDAAGVEITAYAWLPGGGGTSNDTDVIADPLGADEPIAIVQISHGIGEHALRYDAFARVLANNGFAVYADDHRGHGETGRGQHGGDLSLLGRLGPGGLRATEAAILQLTGIARERHPDLPLAMLGHSWGSLMAQRILNSHPRAWNALILTGSAYRTLASMESGELNRHWRHEANATGFEWLSRDVATVRAFVADPLCFEANILKLFGPVDGLRLFGTPAAGLDPNVPILIASGEDDPLSRGDSLQRLADAYRKRGVRDVTLRVYPGGRHEILNETNREAVYADIVTWLQDRLALDG